MKVKINDAYKAILTTDQTNVSADDAALAWVVNRALASVGAPPMFDIDGDDGDALVVLAPAPDDYRGDLDAISILYPDVNLRLVDDNSGQGDVHAVYRKRDNLLLGHLISYFGNNGKGGLAAQDFDPAPGVLVRSY